MRRRRWIRFRCWFELAGGSGLFGSDREFLLGVPARLDAEGDEVFEWRRVRLLPEWDLVGAGARVLGSGPGRPEYRMASLDGRSVMQISTYQAGVSSIALWEPWRAITISTHMQRIVELAELEKRADVPDRYRTGSDAWLRYLQHHVSPAG